MRYYGEGSRRRGQADSGADALARGLGWFSIGLGLAEVIAPRALARALGMEGSETLIRTYGMREIGTGVGILTSDDPTPWIWARVAGDALDLATLATGLEGDNPKQANLALAIGSVAMVTALDVYFAQRLSRETTEPLAPLRDYGDRSGFPRSPRTMRGEASNFEVPRDFRTPEALRPWPEGRTA